jgi:tetratricopeptide (TPR) repeat protein
VVRRFQLDTRARRILFVAAVFALVITNIFIGKWAFGNMISTRAEQTDLADLSVELAPSDPQTHYAAAVVYDKTFLASDEQRSLSEYETATALSPHNYLLWLEYGKALGRSGDEARAETALRRAKDLAPNYAAVGWALGNLLVRTGKEDEGFTEIKRAVEGDSTFAAPAVSFAYQYFGGDVSSIRNVTGTSAEANASLALALAKDKRYADAADVWRSIVNAAQSDVIANASQTLLGQLIAAKKYRLALDVSSGPATPEQINDGGFEDAIKLENAGPFEWQITPGSQPQPLQSTSQAHGGQRALVLRFSSNDGSGLRQLSQTVAVEPAAKYRFTGFYRSDVQSDSHAVWQIVAGNNVILAEVPVSTVAANWTQFSASFAVPAESDGIEIRLIVKGCSSAICPIQGSLWLDDLSIARI